MPDFTVIGLYDNGQRYVEHFVAESADDAAMCCAEQADADIDICAVIAGHHTDLLDGEYVHSTSDLLQETDTE